MELKNAYQKMCTAKEGGWSSMANYLGMTHDSLENRVYERKGQAISIHDALQMQKTTNTTYFAEAIANLSGGVFINLPETGELDHDELLSKFTDLYVEIGRLSEGFKESTEDGHITKKERDKLNNTGQNIHRKVQELLALTFVVYCKQDGKK